MTYRLFFFITLLAISMTTVLSIAGQSHQQPYDPSRDPFADFTAAQAQAQAENKLILIQIGGNWCSWCHKLDRFFTHEEAIKSLLADTFITMKVNVSAENDNAAFINEMPEFEGYPFLVITDAHGQILNSRTSGALESGNGYSVDLFTEYFTYWKNRPTDTES